MVLNSSYFGPNCCENRDLPAPRSNIDQNKTGDIMRKKQKRLSTEEGDDEDTTEHVRRKKMKRSNTETEADGSSADHSCFVALVTASNLHNDALYLPQDLTRLVGLKRNCREIVVTDERERSWALDLRFNKSFNTFYISQGWTSFCDEIGKKAGSVFVFELVGNWETPVLSFCSAEAINEGIHGDKNNKDYCMELKSKKMRTRCRDSTSPSQNPFVTLTLTHGNLRYCRRCLPSSFTRENGLDKPGMITLIGKDGTKWEANLLREKRGMICIRKGWKDFAIANGLKSGESFMLEAILENGTPMLSLVSTQSTSDRSKQGECSKHSEKATISAEHSSGKETRKSMNNRDVRRDSFPASQNRFVTLSLTHDNLRRGRRYLPLSFTKENGLDEPGIITLVGNDGTKLEANLLRENTGIMCLGKGWKEFAMSNGLKTGELFTLEAILENGTPMLGLFSTQSRSDRSQQGECSKYSEKDLVSAEHGSGKETRKAIINRDMRGDSYPASRNPFVTLRLTYDNLRNSRRYLPLWFTKENDLDEPGIITLVGNNGTKLEANLLRENTGIMCLGKGWKEFAMSNGLKCGELFTLEAILENGTPMLSLFCTQSRSDRSQQGECSKHSEKESISAEHSSGKETRKAIINRDVRRDCFPASRNPFVTLRLTYDNLRKSRRYLPLSFTRENGLDEPGIITLVGNDGTKLEACLLRENTGIMCLGKGWKEFAMSNGLRSGELFTLEAILEYGIPMLSLVSTQSTRYRSQQGECAKDSKKESNSAVPSKGIKNSKATSNREERRDSSSAIQNRFVTFTLTPEDVRACKLILPSQFMKANGINKLGKITLLGQNKMKWFAYLLSEDGTLALGSGWKGFCEANGVKTGESFTLEYIDEQDTTPVIKFCSNSVE